MNPTAISDETLHAFVDGQLDIADSEALIACLRADQALAQRVCSLRSLKSMVRLAHAEPPPATGALPRPSRIRPRLQRLQRCAVGCLVLLAGLIAGWGLRGGVEAETHAQTPLTALDGYQPVSLAQQPDPNRIVLHLDSDDPTRMAAVLDRAEALLDEADRQGRAIELEVVANSHGINLMRAGVSPHAARIARMTQRHANLHLVACSQTIARFTGQGQKVELLPVAQAAPTAIGEIVSRLQQGWTYVKV
ncbi:MAG: hypothetical protein AB1720_09995 [Pseudomonadota bacterium]